MPPPQAHWFGAAIVKRTFARRARRLVLFSCSAALLARVLVCLMFVAMVSMVSMPALARQGTVQVFAAASLKNVIDAAAQEFQEKTGHVLLASYAASSVIARQIAWGAPADVFLSADMDWMDYLEARDLIVRETRTPLAGNSLVMVTAKDRALPAISNPDTGDRDWRQRLIKQSLVIADPTHVPAGRYAKQALQILGFWGAHQGQKIFAANARAALVVAARQEADIGIIYNSDAFADKRVKVIVRFSSLLHTPIVYPAAVIKDSRHQETARAFIRFLAGKRGQDIFTAHGFLPAPVEKPDQHQQGESNG